MKNLTDIVKDAKKLAHGNSQNYPLAAIQALRKAGYSNAHQQLGVTYHLKVDVQTIKYNDRTSLLSLVTMCLGQEGGVATSIARAESRQLLFALS